MTWTPEEHRAVTTALIGSWPSHVSRWGEEAIAAYVHELQERALSADAVLLAIRTWSPDADVPPTAAKLAQHARRDPEQPSFDEMWWTVFGADGVLAARTSVRKAFWEPGERELANDEAGLERAAQAHPLVRTFVAWQGIDRLRRLQADLHGEYAEHTRKRLADAWKDLVERVEHRQVTELVSARAGELGRLDPAAQLQQHREEQ